MQANVKLAGAMGTATKTMTSMNQLMKPEDVAKNMKEFEMASAKLDMSEEVGKYLRRMFLNGYRVVCLPISLRLMKLEAKNSVAEFEEQKGKHTFG